MFDFFFFYCSWSVINEHTLTRRVCTHPLTPALSKLLPGFPTTNDLVAKLVGQNSNAPRSVFTFLPLQKKKKKMPCMSSCAANMHPDDKMQVFCLFVAHMTRHALGLRGKDVKLLRELFEVAMKIVLNHQSVRVLNKSHYFLRLSNWQHNSSGYITSSQLVIYKGDWSHKS